MNEWMNEWNLRNKETIDLFEQRREKKMKRKIKGNMWRKTLKTNIDTISSSSSIAFCCAGVEVCCGVCCWDCGWDCGCISINDIAIARCNSSSSFVVVWLALLSSANPASMRDWRKACVEKTVKNQVNVLVSLTESKRKGEERKVIYNNPKGKRRKRRKEEKKKRKRKPRKRGGGERKS